VLLQKSVRYEVQKQSKAKHTVAFRDAIETLRKAAVSAFKKLQSILAIYPKHGI
jgi:hypothetical protein